MSSVDNRIVNMQFNSKQFTQGAADSAKALGDVENSLAGAAKSKGLNDLGTGVEGLSGKFSAMRIAGVTAIATIANRAVSDGIRIAKSFTLDPIKEGLSDYQTNLTAIQTVMANTSKKIGPVNKALGQLQTYANLTVYDFAEMAKNVGTFTAAGVGLKESVSAIQGIANLAALSGSNSQQAATAMYQLSQAISAGQVHLQDWNSVVNAGMGGKNFQKALITTGEAMKTIDSTTVKMGKNISIAGNSFRNSLSAKGKNGQSWLSADVLTRTLSLLDGRLSKSAMLAKGYNNQQIKAEMSLQHAKLKTEGYNNAQIKQLESLADRAYNSATVIKTIPQLMETVKSNISAVWAQAFSNVLGNFNKSKTLLTKVNNSIGLIVTKFGNALNGVANIKLGTTDGILTTFSKVARDNVIAGLTNTFKALGAVLGTIGKGFRMAFPPTSAATVQKIGESFLAFSTHLTPSAKTLEQLTTIFGGFFAVLHIGVTIVKAVASLFTGFFGEILKNSGSTSGGLLQFAASIGQMLINADKFISSGGKLVDLFHNIGKAAGTVAGEGLSIASSIIFGIINGLIGGQAFQSLKTAVETIGTNIITWIKAELGIHSPAATMVPVGANVVAGIVQGILGAIVSIGHAIAAVGHFIKAAFKQLFGGMDALDFASVVNALLTGGLLAVLMRMGHALNQAIHPLSQVINGLTNDLSTMQNTLRAKTIELLAISIGILAGSIIALSMVPAKKLAVGLGAVSTLMGQVGAAMFAMSKTDKEDVGGKKFLSMAAAMDAMATAIVFMAAAVAVLGNLDVKTLAKGIGAMALVMGIMVTAVQGASEVGPMAKGASFGILLMANAMVIMAGAVLAFGKMGLGTLAKGLGAIAIGLGLMVVALSVLSDAAPGAIASAAGIAIVASAMVTLAIAVLAFGKMGLGTLAKGFGAVAIGLTLMVAALVILSDVAPTAVASAAAILIMSAAMVVLAAAVGAFGSMSTGTLVKGFIAMAAGLTIFLLAAAGAELVAPGLEVLGSSVLMLGAGLALAGIGMAAFSTGLAILATLGPASMTIIIGAINSLLGLLPAIAQQVAAAVISFIKVFADAMPKLRSSFDKIFQNLVEVVTDNVPVIGKLFQKLIDTAIGIIKKTIPEWVEMGATVIDKFIGSVAKHVPHIAGEAIDLVTGFINAIASRVGKLADSAAKLVIAYINAIADAINNNVDALRNAGIKLALAIVNGMTGGLGGKAVGMIKSAVKKLTDLIPSGVKKILNINSPSKVMYDIGVNVAQGLAGGISSGNGWVAKAVDTIAARAVASTANQVANNPAYTWGEQIAIAMAAGIKGASSTVLGAIYDLMSQVQGQGNATVTKVAQASIVAQNNADIAQAKADLASRSAAKADNTAGKKGATKKQKQAAKKADSQANVAQAAADKAQTIADAAAQKLQDQQDITNDEQSGDFNSAGDIYSQQAQDLAKQAAERLAKANAEVAKAKTLSGKAKQAMLKLAADDAAAAASLSKQAQTVQNEALDEYGKGLQARLDAYDKMISDEAWQKTFDSSDAATQAQMLTTRAAQETAEATEAQKEADAARAAAQAAMSTDAAAAADQMDIAEQKAQEASDAADAAKQDSDQAAQLLNQDVSTVSSAADSSNIQPSRSVLEDAASSVDRYTASLAEAQALASADTGPVQFIQTNNSPVALSPTEIYRQTKNLISQSLP